MASKRKLGKNYRGPVEEAADKSPIGFLADQARRSRAAKQKAAQASAAKLRQQQVDAIKRSSRINTSPEARRARKVVATSVHKQAGTRYDPLSSISTRNGSSGAPKTTKKTVAKAKPKASRKAQVRRSTKAVMKRNSGMSKAAAKKQARKIVRKRSR